MSRENHQLIDGKLLQIDKKYSNLKMKQKEKINLWINEEIRQYYDEYGNLRTALLKIVWKEEQLSGTMKICKN